MKKLFIAFMMALMSIGAHAQTEVHQSGKRPVYCCVMGYNFWGVGKVKVQLDLGRKTNTQSFDSLYEPNGKKMKFNSMMSVLNYMSERGWRCINNYYLTKGNNQVIHYLMEKWITSDDEITEGLSLKEDTDSEPWKPGKNGDDMY